MTITTGCNIKMKAGSATILSFTLFTLLSGCAPTGACCRDERCDVSTEEECDGVFRVGESCTPNPCAGACCDEEGACEAERTAEQCEGVGRYLGDGTTCDPNMCVGACCAPDGQCVIINEPDCDGEFVGPATTCEPNPCVGACCDEAGDCTVTTEDNCSGFYEGGGTVCSPAACRGACCNEVACTLQTIRNCDVLSGSHQGFGTACEPNPCGGACCSGGFCDVKKEADCPGDFHAGVSCDPNICAGACCRTNGTCEEEVSEADCVSKQGQYLGDGTGCSADSCLGACCKSGECTRVTQVDCEGIEGLYQGHTTTCDPDPCAETVIGACCLSGSAASCELVSMAACSNASGTFLGENSVCSAGCPCVFADDCPTASDLCLITLCESGACISNPKCTSGQECDPANGACVPTNEPAVCCFGTACEDNTFGSSLDCISAGGTPISGATCAQMPNPCLP